jgi:oxalate decarboxylase/phosphoglucose isomerase-like protein (cupin superfamily)
MKVSTSPLPCSVAFENDTGVIPEATAHYQKRLSDLRGLFLDPEALDRRIREENDPICYENYAVSYSEAEGDIFFGTTIIYPGKVARNTTSPADITTANATTPRPTKRSQATG